MADSNSGRDAVVTTGGWFVFMILMAIPIVNVIVVLVEAFGSGSNRNKQGYCRALIIWFILYLIGTGLVCGLCWGALKVAAEKINSNIGSSEGSEHIMLQIDENDKKSLSDFLKQFEQKSDQKIKLDVDKTIFKVQQDSNVDEKAE